MVMIFDYAQSRAWHGPTVRVQYSSSQTERLYSVDQIVDQFVHKLWTKSYGGFTVNVLVLSQNSDVSAGPRVYQIANMALVTYRHRVYCNMKDDSVG